MTISPVAKQFMVMPFSQVSIQVVCAIVTQVRKLSVCSRNCGGTFSLCTETLPLGRFASCCIGIQLVTLVTNSSYF